ncbi:MAG: hypothetical protein KAR05_03185 [Candidatus Omnitrophica bacterium]|nr:hypothetical protein [Candidatus Omnitrophota bacterium]
MSIGEKHISLSIILPHSSVIYSTTMITFGPFHMIPYTLVGKMDPYGTSPSFITAL